MSIKKPEIVLGDVIATLRRCDGVYECPMSTEGKPLGPLVGYAGQYEEGGKLLNYVGFVYYNVGKGDQWSHISSGWAMRHAQLLTKYSLDVLVAAPMGGISYMSVLKLYIDCCRGIFAEKKVIEAAQEGKREKSKLILGRYDICEGDRVILLEDIVNNFSTTKQMIELVENAGGKVQAIACVINRSLKTTYWEAPARDPLPVICLEHRPTPQYRQDDPVVAEYIAVGNVIMKPKDRWAELVAAEAAYA
ncbi:MAG: phosphoribosyltransferase [Candidatus Moraniibacteriota bacterium]